MKIYKYLFLVILLLPLNVSAEDLNLSAKINGGFYNLKSGILFQNKKKLISNEKIFIDKFSKLSYGIKKDKIFIVKNFSDADASYKDLYLIEHGKLDKIENKNQYLNIKFKEFFWKDNAENKYKQKTKIAYDLYLSYREKHLKTKKSCMNLHKNEDILGAYGFDYLIYNFSENEINYIVKNCNKKIEIDTFAKTLNL